MTKMSLRPQRSNLKSEETLRKRIINEIRDQGFDIIPQLQLPFDGFWFNGELFSFDDVDAQKWGYKVRVNIC